ncbi:hypothetical protein DPMN_066296 [Dreissena polymorpha]|uniref:Uncharacterized protein n=1 Tax=Dreissena polymorpha TaxID=45954 RepID=A0A9D3YT78_DREPO|nr:hypothetical protein DPMN_066296 [Dreissena polymorpha]
MRQPHIRTVYPTWRVYPRVQYFRNRFLSLYPRFKTTVGSVQWKIRDHLEAINNLFEADLEVLIIANSECPIESVIVDQTSLPESTDKFHDQKGSKTRVCLCFIEGNVREPQFTERLQDVIGAFNNTPASEECFLFVTFKLSENPSHEQRTNLQYELDKRLKRRPHCWNKSSSVVFEVDGTELPLSISDYFEKLLYEAFSEVAICLKLFIPSEQLVDMKTTHFDFEKFVSTDNAIDPIVSGIRAMEIKSSPSTHGSEENIGSEGLLNLARIIKCLVLFTTYEKLSISSNITQAILVESHFEEKFTKQIKPSSINLLLEIKGIKKEITTVELTEETHMSYKQKINSLLKLIMTDILSLVQNLEKRVYQEGINLYKDVV